MSVHDYQLVLIHKPKWEWFVVTLVELVDMNRNAFFSYSSIRIICSNVIEYYFSNINIAYFALKSNSSDLRNFPDYCLLFDIDHHLLFSESFESLKVASLRSHFSK